MGKAGHRVLSENWRRIRWVLVMLALVLMFNFFFTPGFFRIEIKDGHLYGSVIDIIDRAAPVMLLALGMTLVIATGGVDLSVGAVMAIVGALAAKLTVDGQHGFAAVIIFSLICGASLGLWNGALVAFIGVQPIVATLILMVAGRGVAQLITDGQILTFDHPALSFIGGGYVFGFPFSWSIVAFGLIITLLLVRKSALGLFLECSGDNEIASRYAGVNTRFVKCFAYSMSGFFAAIAGLIVASDIRAADANNAGLYFELDAILAVVLGGTALTGGRFFLVNSLVGAILIQSLTTTILTTGTAVELTLVVKALIILAVCLFQSEQFRSVVARPLPKRHEAAS